MKKIVLSALLMLTVIGNVFSLELNDYKVLSKINNESTLRSLASYLNADADQKGKLKYVFELTERKVNEAVSKGCEIEAEKALNFNLANMKHLLSDEQYKKYLVVLNLTVAGNEEILVAGR